MGALFRHRMTTPAAAGRAILLAAAAIALADR